MRACVACAEEEPHRGRIDLCRQIFIFVEGQCEKHVIFWAFSILTNLTYCGIIKLIYI